MMALRTSMLMPNLRFVAALVAGVCLPSAVLAAEPDAPLVGTFYLFADDEMAKLRADVASTVETEFTVSEDLDFKGINSLLGEDDTVWDVRHEEVAAGCTEAREKLAELETETALPGMKECVRGLESLLGLAEVRDDLYKNLQSLAIAFFLNGSDGGAEKALRQALILKPDPLALDPEMFPLKMRPILDELLLNFELDKAVLNVTSNPPGAEIYLNGILVGTAPMALEGLFYGRAYITARMPGHAPFVDRVLVDAPELPEMTIEMPAGKVDLHEELVEARRAFGSERLPGRTVVELRRKLPVDTVIFGLLSPGDEAGIRVRLCAYELTEGRRLACRSSEADSWDSGAVDALEAATSELVAKMVTAAAPVEDVKPKGPGFFSRLGKVVKNPIFLGAAGGVVLVAVGVTLAAVLIPRTSIRPFGGTFVGGL